MTLLASAAESHAAAPLMLSASRAAIDHKPAAAECSR